MRLFCHLYAALYHPKLNDCRLVINELFNMSPRLLSQSTCGCNIRFSNTAVSVLPAFFKQAPGCLCGLVSISVNLPLIHLLFSLFQPQDIWVQPETLTTQDSVEYRGIFQTSLSSTCTKTVWKQSLAASLQTLSASRGLRTQDVAEVHCCGKADRLRRIRNKQQLWH